MKIGVMIFAAFAALTGSCATQATKEYVDKRDAASVADSKGYTDIKVAELARDLPTKDTLKPLVEDIIKTNISPWAREESKPIYTYDEVGALSDKTFIPRKVSDIENDLNFVQKSVFDSGLEGKLPMSNPSGTAQVGWMDPNIFFGIGSFMFGVGCSVNPTYSFATGYKTVAGNEYSHAEGYQSRAMGKYSHAEGDTTIASGQSSHAEGRNSSAEGYMSHAEGFGTIASGNYSHAEGRGSKAIGESSHAEGYTTTAEDSYTHAEGFNTKALGGYSHAEGVYTVAMGTASHAEGRYSYATNNNSFVWQGAANNKYGSHGDGTFNINPYKGIEGFYVGEKNLKTIITEVAPGGGGGGGVSEARVGEIATNVVREAFKRFDGKVFDFNSMSGVYEALSNVVYSLGGTITNFPPIRR